MKFVGLDLGGVNSLMCARDDAGNESFRGSAHPERPSCVLLPLVRKEKILAGDEALRNERGLGLAWPPLAMAARDGWSSANPPTPGGRLLLATVWQRLVTGGNWQEPQWHPPDGLPALTKPTPTECLTAEALSVWKQAVGAGNYPQIVLAIPNQLPEESQESLLNRLPSGARLVWRSVAAAMSWAEVNGDRVVTTKRLAVLDAGLHGIEISIFEFRREEMAGKIFHVPVRRLSHLHHVNTETLFADSPAPFARLHPALSRLEQYLNEISAAIGGPAELLVCGPVADSLVVLLNQRFPKIAWPNPDPNAVARGSCLFAWRLARDWPTYLDVLPSLELFTLTEEHEPNWLPLIPADCEVAGGRNFQQLLPRRMFIEKGTPRLASWLQRSGENEFRKLSTDLPLQAAEDAWVDLNVSARSASGFARVRITPSSKQFDVFGPQQSLMLNWQSMERVTRAPKQLWPIEVRHGSPKCGKLYAWQDFFRHFLATTVELESSFRLSAPQRLTFLGRLKECVRQTISPRLAGVMGAAGDAAPVNLLVCFSTAASCEFLGGGGGQIVTAMPSKQAQARAIANLLWSRLQLLQKDARAVPSEINSIIYILGRMAGCAPDAFQNQLARDIHPVTNPVRLFAAGRVLATPDHGRRLFSTLKEKYAYSQSLNNNWLRALVYILYQREAILREVPRADLVAAASLCLDQFEHQVRQRNTRIIFMNSLRALALLLRARRHAQNRDFLYRGKCPQVEEILSHRLMRSLAAADSLNLSPASRTLVGRVTEWLEFKAATDEMPPIAPPDEDDEVTEGQNDD